MTARRDGYAPGWEGDAVSMMASRSAEDRAGFALRLLAEGRRVIDVGCGPGTVTVGLARAVGPSGWVLGIDAEPSQIEVATAFAQRSGVANVRFEVGTAYELPVQDGGLDVYCSHAMFEHLSRPQDALVEARRALRVGGLVAVYASDWSRAEFDPWTPDVALAMEGHFLLRCRAGGDPFAGSRLADLARGAGFADVRQAVQHRVDLEYRQLAAYVLARLETSLREGEDDEQLVQACAAAARWADTDGGVVQCWTEITAHRSS